MRPSRPGSLFALALILSSACSSGTQVRPPESTLPPPSDATTEPARPPRNPPRQPLTAPRAEGLPSWKEIDQLVDEEKLEAAARATEKRYAAFRNTTDPGEWTRALIRLVQLRAGLHGYETAVRFLLEEPWPQDPPSQTVLELFYASTLGIYARAYGHEIRQRERVDSKGPVDLRAWTIDQLNEEANRAYAQLWARRHDLGVTPVSALPEYIEPNNYPPHIRGTLRDAVSYFWVNQLEDDSNWRPEHANEVFTLDLASLLEGKPGPRPDVALDDPEVHPLVRAMAILDDLEGWHLAADRKEAAFEARLNRVRVLGRHFTRDDQWAAIRGHLEQRLETVRELPWWSMGMAELALAYREGQELAKAREVALSCERPHPESVGARKCRAIRSQIEQPQFRVASMAVDGPQKRSIEVTHTNLGRLYFRAYAVEGSVEQLASRARDWNLFPEGRDVRALVTGAREPAAEWSVELPPTPDFRMHRTFVTPPLTSKGLYTIVASARPDFAAKDNQVVSTHQFVSGLVLHTRPQPDGVVEVRVVDGETGASREGVEVQLWKYDWNKGHSRQQVMTSDRDGWVRFRGDQHVQHFVIARSGDDALLDPHGVSFFRPPPAPDEVGAFVYTDRTIYRPGQKVSWKAVVYGGKTREGRLQTLRGRTVTVTLFDGNDEPVADLQGGTNDFGTLSGEFAIPAGRLLGSWSIRVEEKRDEVLGDARIRVEEYKRPTFEAKVQEPAEPLRLNREASLTGEARYYFGQPVTSGEVRWQVKRVPVFPWWWGWVGPTSFPVQVVAGGTARLDEAGRFSVKFTPRADEELADAKSVSYRYELAADVTDEGGETRTANRAFRVGFVTVQANVSFDSGFAEAAKPAKVEVTRSDLDGTPRGGKGTWVLVALQEPAQTVLPADEPQPPSGGEPVKKTFETEGDKLQPRWTREYQPERTLAGWKDGAEKARGEVTHDDKGVAKFELPALEPGAYRLKYQTQDPFGATFEAAREVVVAGKGYAPRLPLLFSLDRSSARAGETVRAYVRSGFANQRVLVEWYRDGKVVKQELVGGTDGDGVVTFKVTDADRGGLGLRATTVRDYQPVTVQHQLAVPWDDKELRLEFATFRDLLRPGAKETFTIKVSDSAGEPVEARAAEVLAYMFDQSLDLFGPHEPPEVKSAYPLRWYLPPQRTSTQESHAQWVMGEDFVKVVHHPELATDALKFFDGYSIGGPGTRGLLRGAPAEMQAADSAQRERAAPSPKVTLGLGDAADQRSFEALAAEDAAAEPARPEGDLRTLFAETAFWAPNLITGKDGSVSLQFTVPDSVTGWHVWAHAITRDLRGGAVSKDTRSVKDLIVRPYVPRFLRESDRAELQVVIDNTSDRELKGTLDFDLIDPETQRTVARDFALDAKPRAFTVPAKKSVTLGYPLVAPKKTTLVAVRAIARAGELSDGELRPFPVLPSRMHLAQSRFVTFQGPGTRTMKFEELARDDDPTRLNEQLVVTVDAQLFHTALNALPYLVDYPYDCTEQMLNRFVSTGIVSHVFQQYPAVAKMAAELSKRDTPLETWDAIDPNRKMALEETPWLSLARGGTDDGKGLARVLDPEVAEAERLASLEKLRKSQTQLGGFPWWPGGPPSPYMTVYILHGLARARDHGVPVPRDIAERAWGYLNQYVTGEELAKLREGEGNYELLTFLNYVATAYPAKEYPTGIGEETRRLILDHSFAHWKDHSPYLKGYLALTLKRMDRARDARLVWDSVMDSAKTDPDLGTYWAPEERGWLWYNDRIETHAFALTTLMELEPEDPRRAGLVQWLLLNKKLNQWKSTRATAEVIYALVKYLEREGELGVREVMKVSAPPRQRDFVFEPDRYVGRAQVVVPAAEVKPEATSTVTVEKQGKGFAFASATWHFSTDRLPTQERGDFFEVKRTYFRRDRTGRETKLVPLTDGATIAVGDELEVHLSLRVKHAAEYVHLRDPRAAGFEPENAVSRYTWDLGVGRYEEVRDSGTNFFFDWVPVGEYPLKYRLRANLAGTFRVGPATVQSMYAPEFNAYSAGNELTIGPARSP